MQRRRLVRPALAAWALWCSWWRPAAAKPMLTLTLHRDGQAMALDTSASGVAALVAACLAQVQSATGVLRLAVSAHSIEALRRGGLAIELQWASTQQLQVLALQRSLTFKRLLVPLAGELSGPVSTLFLGLEHYSAGPLRNPAGTATLRTLVDSALASQR